MCRLAWGSARGAAARRAKVQQLPIVVRADHGIRFWARTLPSLAGVSKEGTARHVRGTISPSVTRIFSEIV